MRNTKTILVKNAKVNKNLRHDIDKLAVSVYGVTDNVKKVLGLRFMCNGLLSGKELFLETANVAKFTKDVGDNNLKWVSPDTEVSISPGRVDITEEIARACTLSISGSRMLRVWSPVEGGGLDVGIIFESSNYGIIVDGGHSHLYMFNKNGWYKYVLSVPKGYCFSIHSRHAADIAFKRLMPLAWLVHTDSDCLMGGVPENTELPVPSESKNYVRSGNRTDSWRRPHVRRAHWRRDRYNNVHLIPATIVGALKKDLTETVKDPLRRLRDPDNIPVAFR